RYKNTINNKHRIINDDDTTMRKQRTANSTYPKVAVQWLNQALCFYQSFCLVDSEVLRNRQLLLAANRQAVKKPLFSFMLSNSTIFKTDFCCLFAL
ncbi:MAG: hypothetical protein ACK5CO_00520, partial [Bacteroidota bacterium]